MARVVRAICISDSAPSCMRAPPAAVKATMGTPRLAASLAAAMKPSPAAMPSEPPINAKSCTSTTAATSLMVP